VFININKEFRFKRFSIDVTDAITKDDIHSIIFLFGKKKYYDLPLHEKENEVLKHLSYHLSNHGLGEKILNFLVFDYAISQENINFPNDRYIKKRIESMLAAKSLKTELSENQDESKQDKKLKI
jgi:hypothetical protein